MCTEYTAVDPPPPPRVCRYQVYDTVYSCSTLYSSRAGMCYYGGVRMYVCVCGFVCACVQESSRVGARLCVGGGGREPGQGSLGCSEGLPAHSCTPSLGCRSMAGGKRGSTMRISVCTAHASVCGARHRTTRNVMQCTHTSGGLISTRIFTRIERQRIKMHMPHELNTYIWQRPF